MNEVAIDLTAITLVPILDDQYDAVVAKTGTDRWFLLVEQRGETWVWHELHHVMQVNADAMGIRG